MQYATYTHVKFNLTTTKTTAGECVVLLNQ